MKFVILEIGDTKFRVSAELYSANAVQLGKSKMQDSHGCESA